MPQAIVNGGRVPAMMYAFPSHLEVRKKREGHMGPSGLDVGLKSINAEEVS